MILAIGAAFLCLAGSARANTGTPVIIDSDMFTSADDVGAMSMAFADANVLAVNLNQRVMNGQRPVSIDTYKCANAIAAFYGAPNVPIGVQSTPTTVAPNTPDFVGPCGKLDPNPVPSTFQSAVSVDTTALTNAAANSVVIICTGYEGNLEALLKAQPTLVSTKVKELVIMGGGYPTWTKAPGENNFYGDPASAAYVAANWPTPIVYSGQEVGDAVLTGHSVSTSLPAYAPLRVAYEAFVGEGRNIYSYDLTAAYHGIVPSDTSLTESAAGTNAVSATDGTNTFTAGSGTQHYLTLTSAPNLEGSMESLLDTPGSIAAGTAPTNNAAPAISGTPQMGQTLTASGDSWTPSTAQVTYQWFHCTSTAQNSCSEISQPTSNQLVLNQATLGDLTGQLIEVQAQASVAGASSPVVTSAQVTVVPPLGVPANTARPGISGTAQDGQTLTELPGTWSNSPNSISYQWEQCNASGTGCTAITGATGQTYTVSSSDVGNTIVVTETAKNTTGSSLPASSLPTAVVSEAATPVPANISAPGILGNAVAGQTLSETHGSWTGNPTGYTYQWELCDWMGNNCSPISGATSQNYTLTGADVGNTIRVLESATNGGGSSAPATSSATGLVAGPPSGNNPPPPPGGSRNVTTQVIHTALMQALVLHGGGARIRTLQRTHQYLFTFTAPAAGRLVVSWYYTPRHGRRVLVGTARVVVHHAGRARIKLVLTGKGRALLRHSRTLRLTAIAGFTPLHERTTSASRKLTLRR
ncbi:MAG TPA: nucleoside hydrolase [Solirubrobacteraceae bacterium]|nr:nucleoside hydrolase [Solirubrobacteraceae bacterium]